jgi:peptide/nickel transport system substrate-binding protein
MTGFLTGVARRGLGLMVVAALVGSAAAQAQTSGGTLRLIAQPEPPMLILGLNQAAPTQYVSGKIYESLLTYDANLKPKPGLAKSWKVSADGLTYTFELQSGVKWHDGKPFTAADVAFTFDKFLREAPNRSKAVIEKYLASATTEGDTTVIFKLKSPFQPFMSMFEVGTSAIVPRHIYEGTDYRTNPANQTPIGTGPFMFKEWKKGSSITLVKNPNYWRKGLPHLDQIVFQIVPDAASRSAAFEKGDIDVLRGGDVDNVDIARLKALTSVQSTTKGWEMYSPMAFMVLNERRPPFDNVKVRQAIMVAMNRKFIVNSIFFGQGKVATGPIASTTMFYDKNVAQYDFNLKKAKELIKESGVNPAARPVKILSLPYGSDWDRLGEYTKQVLTQLGFNVELENTDTSGWFSRVGNWDFDVSFSFTYQYGDPAIGVARHFLSSNIIKGSPFVNNQGYSNPAVDEAFNKGAGEADTAARQAAYSAAQKIIADDVALGYMFEMQYTTLSRGAVKNLPTTAIGLNDTMAETYIQK